MLAKTARTRIRLRRNPPIEAERWIRDPRGIEVLLSARVWVDHVVRRHHYMAARYHEVVAVVEAPELITRSPWTRGIDLYYGASPRLRVVVLFERPLEARIITAYEDVEPDQKEVVAWMPY